MWEVGKTVLNFDFTVPARNRTRKKFGIGNRGQYRDRGSKWTAVVSIPIPTPTASPESNNQGSGFRTLMNYSG